MIDMLQDFIPELLKGFVVNLEIAFGATVIGLGVGLPLAVTRMKLPGTGRVLWSGVRLMQAAPVYVVMFFILNLLPRSFSLFGTNGVGLAAVTLAQSTYMSGYVADNLLRALQQYRRHERDQALLFIPNLLRGFVVVCMSSGLGAAIGVSEAVGVTMRQAARLHSAEDRIVLFLVVIAIFSTLFGTAMAVIRRVVGRLSVRPEGDRLTT